MMQIQTKFIQFSIKNVNNFTLHQHRINKKNMGQGQSNGRVLANTTRSYQAPKNEQFYNRRIEHQGLIKLRAVPFKNCIQIQTQSSSIFLQNIEVTLKDLLDSRLYTNKLFPKEDIERLIQNITYTLAYMQQNSVPYKDVSAQNIFYDDGSFKLLPNQLIPESRYNKFLQSRSRRPNSQQTTQGDNQFVPLSPQMIIAYRCKQSQIIDLDILDKSNVFYLGLILLQTTTLLPAHECYDTDSCDILDQVVSERIQMIKDYYSDQIASIIANMLDYDYVERMNLKDISIFVNRQLNREITLNSKIGKELSNKKQSRQINCEPVCSDPLIDEAQSATNHSHCKTGSIISKSRIQTSTHNEDESRVSKHQQTGMISEKKRNKTNKVYMNGTIQQVSQEQESTFTREERNKVYMKQPSTADLKKSYVNETPKQQNHRPTSALRQNTNVGNVTQATGKILNARQKFTPSIPQYTQKQYLQHVNNQEEQENRYPTQEYQQKGLKRKNSTDYLGYRAPNGTTMAKTPKKVDYHQRQSQFQYAEQAQNQPSKTNYGYKQEADYNYIPSRKQGAFGQRFVEKQSFANEDSGSRGYFDGGKPVGTNSKVSFGNDNKDHDHSLSRIKSEIQRSRKLIQEFKRGQNSHF